MQLPCHKTKIIATIGPACESPEMLERLLIAGMNIARLNFSHGDFDGHANRIERLRTAARVTGKRVVIMADLPGPKMRIGKISPDPIELRSGNSITLTTEDIIGNEQRVSVSFNQLPQVVKSGDYLFLNDGLIQLVVEKAEAKDVRCKVTVGGELRSRKGLNLPGINLGISAFTDHDRSCLKFAMEHGVDAVCQSFVETASDINAVRSAAQSLGKPAPFIIAKIERSGALKHFDEILKAADGIMVARGDLGVEVPLEEIAITQKELIAKATLAGKPVITATQMLESMVENRLPTRAEATDVANAVLDGTDCVMLSGESAMGRYPEESVAMLAKIASATEVHRPPTRLSNLRIILKQNQTTAAEAISSAVEHSLNTVPCAAVFVPTRTGTTARMISRFKPSVWVAAISRDPKVCQALVFSYGIFPVELPNDPDSWTDFALCWLHEQQIKGSLAVLVAGPSDEHPEANHRIEFMRMTERPSR
jgi:pyruvate kinase